MTCIAAITHDGKVFMGGDSLTSWGWGESGEARNAKCFKVDDVLFGCCGSVRMGQILQHWFVKPEHHSDVVDMKYLCTDFASGIREVMENNKFDHQKEGISEIGGPNNYGNFLIGYHGQIYRMSYDYSVLALARGFDAIGSGAEVAVGALYAMTRLEMDTLLTPRRQIEIAIESASRAINSVGGPIVIIEEDTNHVREKD